jgi:hypothetical protein
MKSSRLTNFRRSPARVVDPIVRQRDLIVFSQEKHSPVMLAIATRAPARLTIKLTVRNRDPTSRLIPSNKKLPPNERKLHVIDPNQICPGQLDGIAAPNVLRVEIRNVEVLKNDVLRAADDPEAFASDHAFGANAYNGLVRFDVDRLRTSNIIRDFDGGIARAAPVRAVESVLPFGSAGVTVRSTTVLGGGALGVEEIVLFVQQDDARIVVGQPRYQLVDVRRSCGRSIAASSNSASETGSRAYDAGLCGDEASRDDGEKR